MKRALITIHGYLTTPNDFGVLYDKADFYEQIFRFVIPGHDGNYKEFENKTTVDDLLRYYDDNLAGKFDVIDVVGFSLGGALACYLATVRKIDSVVLLAPALKIFNPSSLGQQIKLHGQIRRQTFSVSQGNLFSKLKYANATTNAYMKRYSDVVVDWLKNNFPHATIGNVAELLRLSRLANAKLNEVGKLNNPTLVVWGKCDQFVPYSSVQLAKKHFADITVSIHDELDHSMLRNPQNNYVADEVVTFLKNHTPQQ